MKRAGGWKGKEKASSDSIRDEDIQNHRRKQVESMTGVPMRYLEMMKDIHSEASKTSERPLKKRKRLHSEPADGTPNTIEPVNDDKSKIKGNTEQDPVTFSETSSEEEKQSESESDEDIDWEDVELNVHDTAQVEEEQEGAEEPLTISLSAPGPRENEKKKRAKLRKTLSKEEKAQRIVLHKVHLISLLHHVWLRNRWCNDYSVRDYYKFFLSPNITQELNPPERLSETLKSRKFQDGVRHAMNVWLRKFKVTSKGLYLVSWSDIFRSNRPLETNMDIAKFRTRLHSLRGSRDLAAQGFCALLRSQHIKCRLVCSLQPLDFTSAAPVLKTEECPTTPLIVDSKFPIFWIEAWDKFSEKWVSVDPVVTGYSEVIRSTTKSRLEPPVSDKANNLRYVVAFDENGHVTDVTRRYAQHFNSKVRKKRLTGVSRKESNWWGRVLNIFKPRAMPSKWELLEAKELGLRETAEGYPNNLQDFKNHPIYALKRDIRQDETLSENAQPCGKINVRGSTESVYLRKDVKVVKTARAWYKLGRVIKPGSQPLKSKPTKTLETSDDTESAMYSFDQTEVYVPPGVEDGVVPKNAFGNLDIYTPSMIPKNAVHLKQQYISIAAKLINVDYADAVVGFSYSNRRMTPKIDGIIVAKEFQEAVETAYEQLLEEQREEDEQERIAKALLRWRRYLLALRIKDRLNRVHGRVDAEEEKDASEENEKEVVSIDDSESDVSGGFVVEDKGDPNRDDSDGGGGFVANDKDYGEVADDDDDGGGGFVVQEKENDFAQTERSGESPNDGKETQPKPIVYDETADLFERTKFVTEGLPTSGWNQVPETDDDDEDDEGPVFEYEALPPVPEPKPVQRQQPSPQPRPPSFPASQTKVEPAPDPPASLKEEPKPTAKPPGTTDDVQKDPKRNVVVIGSPVGSEEDFFPDSASESELLDYDDDDE